MTEGYFCDCFGFRKDFETEELLKKHVEESEDHKNWEELAPNPIYKTAIIYNCDGMCKDNMWRSKGTFRTKEKLKEHYLTNLSHQRFFHPDFCKKCCFLPGKFRIDCNVCATWDRYEAYHTGSNCYLCDLKGNHLVDCDACNGTGFTGGKERTDILPLVQPCKPPPASNVIKQEKKKKKKDVINKEEEEEGKNWDEVTDVVVLRNEIKRLQQKLLGKKNEE